MDAPTHYYYLYNNSITLFRHCPVVLGRIPIGSVPFKSKIRGESFDPGLVAIR